jgi:hypothetical protein
MFALSNRSFFQEWRRSRRGCRPRFSMQLMLFEEGYTIDIFGLFIPLLFLDRFRREPEEMMESWGFTACDRTIHLNWGDSCKVVHLPWSYTLISHKVRRPDGSWVPYVGSYERDKDPDGRETFAFDYTYTLRNGEVQHRTAEVYVDQWDRRWRMLRFTRLFRDLSQSINYTFSDEVGERTGSWKGGCISSGETMRPGETVEQTFRRMERERKF